MLSSSDPDDCDLRPLTPLFIWNKWLPLVKHALKSLLRPDQVNEKNIIKKKKNFLFLKKCYEKTWVKSLLDGENLVLKKPQEEHRDD